MSLKMHSYQDTILALLRLTTKLLQTPVQLGLKQRVCSLEAQMGNKRYLYILIADCVFLNGYRNKAFPFEQEDLQFSRHWRSCYWKSHFHHIRSFSFHLEAWYINLAFLNAWPVRLEFLLHYETLSKGPWVEYGETPYLFLSSVSNLFLQFSKYRYSTQPFQTHWKLPVCIESLMVRYVFPHSVSTHDVPYSDLVMNVPRALFKYSAYVNRLCTEEGEGNKIMVSKPLSSYTYSE